MKHILLVAVLLLWGCSDEPNQWDGKDKPKMGDTVEVRFVGEIAGISKWDGYVIQSKDYKVITALNYEHLYPIEETTEGI